VIRPFLDGEVERPFLLAMTAAGQSALNIRGLDTVVIYDARYANVVDRGRNVLTRLYMGANEILQMAGRVGRVATASVPVGDRTSTSRRCGPPPSSSRATPSSGDHVCRARRRRRGLGLPCRSGGPTGKPRSC
jgi:hypothetical protein